MAVSNNSSKATGLIVTGFYVEPSGAEETKHCSNSPNHMNYMVAMSLYSKNLKNLRLWNQWTNGLKT